VTSIVMPKCYRFGAFELQVDERRLLRQGAPIALRPHAFDILTAMVERAGHLVTKDELLQRVWGRVVVEENTLQAHVSSLRKVLGTEAIATVSGKGYRFALEVVSDAPAAPTPPPHNLSRSLTSFIGREKQIAEVAQLLISTRLLTLTGAGGCGKSRLALRVAEAMLDKFGEGAWLVELAPLSDPTLIPQAIAKALALQEQVDRPLMDTVGHWLESRHVLLLLDNAEHLLDACAQLTESLLRRCPRLSIVITSRERLGVAGELTYRVPSLSVPDPGHATGDEIFACESVRLFIERAQLQRFGFEVADTDAAALVSICRRLDGIALAIELAAPRVHTMSLEELSAHLDDRFAVLTGGSRTALPRHRTLRSLIDWSHDLLSDDEKTMLRRAAVFAGGWTEEAAGAICSGDPINRAQVLDLLASLVDKSLVVTETRSGVTRFGMLETIRHYAHDRLVESGEEAGVRARHFDYFHGLAGRLDEAKSDAERQGALDRLDQERDNVRAALAWCEGDAARSIDGLSLAGKLYWMWLMRSHFGEGRNWIARLLAVAPGVERGQAHARALHATGTLAHRQGDLADGERHHRQALSIWRRLGERRQMARSLGSLGSNALWRRDFTAARPLYEEATAIMREIGDRRGTAVGLNCLGSLAFEIGDLQSSRAFLEEALCISREIGAASASENLHMLARVWHAQGNFETARRLAMEALHTQRESGDRRIMGQTLCVLATVSHDEGDFTAAKAQFVEALATEHAVGAEINMPDMLDGTAALCLEFAPVTCAARIWGSAQKLRERTGSTLVGPDRERCFRYIARAREALQDDAAFDLAWNEGRSWSRDDAVKYAIELLSAP
jgi:non-specific serine/threonine protein kinase